MYFGFSAGWWLAPKLTVQTVSSKCFDAYSCGTTDFEFEIKHADTLIRENYPRLIFRCSSLISECVTQRSNGATRGGCRETVRGDLMFSCGLTKTKWVFYLLCLGRVEFMSVELRSVRKCLGIAGTAGHLHNSANCCHKITPLAVSVRHRSP
jgi:hypothetical protein